MVDGTRDTQYRMPVSAPSMGGAQPKPDVTAPKGAGTIGSFNDVSDLPPFPSLQDGDGSPSYGSAPHGAPRLSVPKRQLSSTQMAMDVSALLSRIDDVQSSTEENGLQTTQQQRKESFQRSNEAIAKSAKKLADAKHKQKILGPLATIGKIFASIAAIALTVVTAGTAAPLAIAMITYTVIDTACTIANAISQAAGGPALDLGSLLGDAFKEIAKAFGASDKTAADFGKWASFAVQAAIAILTIAVSIKGIVSLVKGTATAVGSLGAKLSTTAFRATKATGIAAQFVGGAATASSGGLGIATAVDTYDASQDDADKAQSDAASTALQEIIRNTLDRLTLLAKDMGQGMQSAAEEISSIGRTGMAVAGGNVSMV